MAINEPTKTGFDYQSVLQRGRVVVPDSPEEVSSVVEMPTLFPEDRDLPPPFVRAEEVPENKEAPREVAVAVTAKAHSEVFVLWRDWINCDRCTAAINSGHATVPQGTGEYTCPHVAKENYIRVLNRCMDGKGVISLKEIFTQPDGTRCAHLEWFVDDPESRKKAEALAKKKKKNQVFPPQPFADDDDD